MKTTTRSPFMVLAYLNLSSLPSRSFEMISITSLSSLLYRYVFRPPSKTRIFASPKLTMILIHQQCAGNRRKEMAQIKKVKGIIWDDGVIANCRWGGVRLREVLMRAGFTSDNPRNGNGGSEQNPYEGLHVLFASHATPCQDDEYYGGSVPLARALDPTADVLLALDVSPILHLPHHTQPSHTHTPQIR